VLLHGAFGHADADRDLLVGEAGGDPVDDLALADRQGIFGADVDPKPPAGDPSGRKPTQQRGHPVHDRTERPRLERGEAG
jgi:hypothetical protein